MGCTSLHFHQQCRSVPFSPQPLQHKLPSVFLILAILTGVRWNLRVVLICISLMTKDVEHFLKCLSAILDSSVESSLFWSVLHFFIELCDLLVSNFLSSLYILEIRPLSDVGLVKIFSHSVGCRFVLLTVSFALQKLFSFRRFHLLISNSVLRLIRKIRWSRSFTCFLWEQHFALWAVYQQEVSAVNLGMLFRLPAVQSGSAM